MGEINTGDPSRRDPRLVLVADPHRKATGRPTLIATTPKIPKGRPRPLADQHLAVLLSTRMARRTWAMILLGAYAVLRVSEIAAIRGAPPCDPGPARGRSWGTVQGATHE
jgi:hypothetical protein